MPLSIRFGWILWLLPFCLPAQIPFYSEDFSGVGLPPGWSTEDSSGNEATYQVLWEKCAAEAWCPPRDFLYFNLAFDNRPIRTTTADNGYLFANSDAVNLPGFLEPHLSRLTSAPIDCSPYNQVVLYFESHIGTFNFHPHENAVLRVSVNATDWTEFPIYPNLGLPTNETAYNTNPGRHWIDISTVAAGSTTVFLQWQWRGEEEWAWIIDDVALYPTHPVYHRSVWGTGPDEGLFENSLEEWSSNPLLNTEDNWIWQPKGAIGDALSAPQGYYLSSASPQDGAAGFNADFYTTGGDEPGPGPFPIYTCELLSPTIDLSEVDDLLTLRFIQSVRLLNESANFPFLTAWTYSVDGGNTWGNWLNANPGIPINGYWEPRLSAFPLPAEVSGSESFRLKFLFAGDLYGWFIDDVIIARREENDLAVQSNFFAINPSLQTPLSAVSPVHFLADYHNAGQNDQPNARAYVEIRHETEGLQFIDSLLLGTIEADQLIENLPFTENYLPTIPGSYEGRYFITSDSADQYPLNDTVGWQFIINDSIFAKELGPTGAFTPEESNDFSYGNCFYIPPGPEQKACFVTFGIGNPQELIYQKVSIILYEIPEGDVNEDLQISSDEYDEIGFTDYTFLGGEGPLITVPITDFNGNTLTLEPDTYYGVLVRYASGGPEDRCFLLGSQQYDLQATYVLYNQVESPRYFSLLDIDNTGTFEVIGLGDSGFDRLPVVRLHLCNNTSSVDERGFPLSLQLYPNPVSGDFLYVTFDSPTAATLRISDGTGTVVFQRTTTSSAVLRERINIGSLRNGIYFLEVYAEDGRYGTGKFVRIPAK